MNKWIRDNADWIAFWLSLSKVAVILAAVWAIFGCTPDNVREVPVRQKVECGAAPKADRLYMLQVEPQVVEDKVGIIWIGITPKHYENLSVNLAAMRTRINQGKAITRFYKECIDRNNKGAKKAPE